MCLNDRIVSFDAWYAQHNALISSSGASSKEECSSTTLPMPLMDLRSEADWAKRRLAFTDTNLTVVPFPIEYLKERSFELPGNLDMLCHVLLE